jgi:sporulation protein YlmC with PRC-barrel domain
VHGTTSESGATRVIALRTRFEARQNDGPRCERTGALAAVALRRGHHSIHRRKNMKHNAKKLLLAAGAVVGTSLLAAAWVTYEGHAHVWLSDTLIGSKVHNEHGEQIGKLEDIVVSPNQDSSYAVLALGSWANMADRYCAMPWSVIQTVEADVAVKDSERKLVLLVDKEMLRTAPNFEKRTWPDMTDVAWRSEIDAFYDRRAVGSVDDRDEKGERRDQDDRDRKGQAQEAGARKKHITWRATELKGADVVTSTNEKLGDIDEIAVDTNGRFCYVAVSAGGFLGMGEHVVAVPWDALQFTVSGEKNDKRVITLASTKEQLAKAPEYSTDKDDRARMCDADWIASVYEHFSVKPYWDMETDAKKAPATPKAPAGK